MIYKAYTKCGNGHAFQRELLGCGYDGLLPETFTCPECGDERLVDMLVTTAKGAILLFRHGDNIAITPAGLLEG